MVLKEYNSVYITIGMEPYNVDEKNKDVVLERIQKEYNEEEI